MNRWMVLLAALLTATLTAVGCSSGGGNLTAPAANPDLTGSVSHVGQAQAHLWGYYDVYIDIENQSAEAVLNRMCMFTANVTTFVNNPVSNLSFKIYGTPVTADYVDVDIDVTIKHPFPGLTQYNGYDVKGVFMGPGSSTMKYSNKLKYAEYGTDQAVYDFNDKDTLAYSDPYGDDLVGMPDGYTRWFNAKEFTFPGIMGYTQGKLATPGYQSMLTATVNPYKYFADGLGADEDLWTWLGDNADTHGVFSAGKSNTRNYYLRFPMSKGVKYGYAVVASWKGPNPADHPANAPEAPACDIAITPDIYYVSGTDKGGSLILDLSFWGWEYQPSLIKIESTVLSAVHTFDAAEMTPTGGDENYSVYHCKIPADSVKGTEGNEFWVIAEYEDFDYTSASTPPGGAPTAVLAAFFRSDLYVANEAYNKPPVIDSGVDGEAAPLELSSHQYSITATDPDGDPLTYSWTLTDVASGDPVEGFDGVPGNGDGTIDIDYSIWPHPWALGGTKFELDCSVTDGNFPAVDATTLDIKVDVDGDLWVSNHPDFASVPDNGTKAEPYSTVRQANLALPSNPGATIVIDYGTGTYLETSDIYLSGSNYSNATFRGYSWHTDPGGRPTIKRGGPSTELMWIYNATGLTFQGLRLEANPVYPQPILMSVMSSNNTVIRDCSFTGQPFSSALTGIDLTYSSGVEIYNNKFYDLGPNPAYSTCTVYCVRVTNSVSGTRTIARNEFTNIFPSSLNYTNTNLYCVNFRTPGGTINVTNNLMHHIKPSHYSGCGAQTGYAFWNSTSNSGVYNFSNNTVDNLDFTNSPAVPYYTLYAYYNSYTGQAPVSRSDIVSTYTGNAAQTLYGYYHYYNGVSGVTYCDAYKIDDYPWGGFTDMTGNIEADPLYVNNTTVPYDYHLQDGSPCEGTGYNGVDMGCYGNLPAGETIVGLITAQ